MSSDKCLNTNREFSILHCSFFVLLFQSYMVILFNTLLLCCQTSSLLRTSVGSAAKRHLNYEISAHTYQTPIGWWLWDTSTRIRRLFWFSVFLFSSHVCFRECAGVRMKSIYVYWYWYSRFSLVLDGWNRTVVCTSWTIMDVERVGWMFVAVQVSVFVGNALEIAQVIFWWPIGFKVVLRTVITPFILVLLWF